LLPGQCVGDLSAKLPYKKIEDYGIIMNGLPSGKQLKHPSSYGLKEILENKDNIKVEGEIFDKLAYKNLYIMSFLSEKLPTCHYQSASKSRFSYRLDLHILTCCYGNCVNISYMHA